ncbi:MAG: hypothetical protein GC161_18475 [Planctomycetaceae bacterium]|nr:hypothetical protein [Planctomycetaceae bacterium]
MSDHYWYIRSPDKQIPECTLPLGKHGTRGNAEIQVGWIKKVARFLRVSDCVAKHIPALRQ